MGVLGSLFFGILVFGLGVPEAERWWVFSPVVAVASAIPALIFLIKRKYALSLAFQIIPYIYFVFGLFVNYLLTGSFFGGINF